MLAGVVERGTAAAARDLAPYVGGKTGTSEDENDTWFAGFTNDVTIVVWVGYDNAEGTRRTLGQGSTGASVALPIFQTIIRAAWANGVPKVALAPPSREARTFIADVPIDLASGTRLPRGGNHAFVEHFRLDAKGQMVERKTRFVNAEENARLKEARRQRAARRAPTVVMQCFLFFCTTRLQ
jgi:membrane carboxypeptidase/penicillin-binding protein